MRLLKFTLSISYLIALFYIVFFIKRRRYLSSRILNIIPIRDLITDFNNKKSSAISNYYSNFFGNIVLFIPFSFFIFAFNTYSYKSVILSALCLSFLIEALQYIFNVGVADVNDILLNSFGALIGVLLNKILFKNETLRDRNDVV